MARAPNGRNDGFGLPSRRIAPDDLEMALTGEGADAPEYDFSVMAEGEQSHSGRRFVVVAAIVVLLTWGGLYLAFQRWRENYRERAAYGASHVVSAVDPLKEITPPDVDPAAWRDAVAKTHAMLLTVVASNLLDLDEMDKLRLELDEFVARVRAHPETGKTELATIWNEMADRAEFLFQDSRDPTRNRHVRPKILPARPPKTTDKANPAPTAR
jgi:hypothetical protein